MLVDIDLLPEIFFQASLFFIVYFLFYRKYIYNIFDPLFSYIFSLSFSSVLVTNVLAESQITFAYHFFWCHFFFFIGFALTTYKYQRNVLDKQRQEDHSLPYFHNYKVFRIVVYVSCALFFLTNIFLLYTKGFALLSDKPSEAKIENFTEGFGVIARINRSLGGFVLAGFFLCLFYKPKFIDIFLLVFSIVLKSLSGSKGAFAEITIIVALIASHSMFRYNKKIASNIKLMTPFGLLGIIIVMFTVFLKESTDTEQAIIKFVVRLLYGADSTLYFYQPVNEQYFSQFHFWEYPEYLFNSILSMLRIVPGIEAHGNTMVLNVMQDQSLIFSGPNSPYYIEGQIYFGYYGAFIYSIIIGALLAISREEYFGRRYNSAFILVLMSCITTSATVLTIEASFGLTRVFETIFFVMPIYIIVNFAVNGSIKWRKSYI